MKYLVLGAIVLVAGCSPDGATQNSTFSKNCVQCHGVSGQGDGPLAASLHVPPANLRLLASNNGGVFPQDAVYATIYGYHGKYLGGAMPEFGEQLTDQAGGDTVTVKTQSGEMIETPRALVELVAYLKRIQE